MFGMDMGGFLLDLKLFRNNPSNCANRNSLLRAEINMGLSVVCIDADPDKNNSKCHLIPARR
jgi:hypothetical protein